MPDSDIYYETAIRKLENQREDIDSLDTKASTMFGFASTILAFLGATLALTNISATHTYTVVWGELSTRQIFFVLLVISITAYGGILYCLWRTYRVRTSWSWRPHLDDLAGHSKVLTNRELKYWVARDCHLSVEKNKQLIGIKGRFLNKVFALVALEAVCLTLAAMDALAAK